MESGGRDPGGGHTEGLLAAVPQPTGSGIVGVVGTPTTDNLELVRGLRCRGCRAEVVSADDLRSGPSTVLIGRLDVLASLDGVEPGLVELWWAERRGVRVVNGVRALLAVHDKLRTAEAMAAHGIPHPRTRHVVAEAELRSLRAPVVLKPRFGSWGRDVMRCRDAAELAACAVTVTDRPWFRRHGVLAQELLPPTRNDLRLIVAAGSLVGAAERVAGPGEWRTNVSLGGHSHGVDPPPVAGRLAVEAAAAAGCGLVGVDLYPVVDGGWLVLELNGAVAFDGRYSLPGRDVYEDIATALRLPRVGERSRALAAR